MLHGLLSVPRRPEYRHLVETGVPDLKVLVTQQDEMGRSSASRTAAGLLDEFEAGIVVCLGIAGGISGDLRLGDVCYSGGILDVYDNSKAVDSEAGGIDVELSPNQYQTPKSVTSSLNFIRTQPDLKPLYQEWCRARCAVAEELVPDTVTGRTGKDERLGTPLTKNDTIVCGVVSKSDVYNQKLRALDRRILAIETESGGVFAQAEQRGIAALTIRGISDYADPNKSELERRSAGGVRRLAAGNAATFFRLQFSNDRFLKAVRERRAVLALSDGVPSVVAFPKRLDDVLQEVGNTIDERLRELSPEFRLQPKGYRLPIPRVRRLHSEGGTSGAAVVRPEDIRDAIGSRRVCVLNLPRSYPDHSLPWIIADDMLTAEINGKQAVPVVVCGEELKRPRHDIEQVAHFSVAEIERMSGCQAVVIVDGLPLKSKSRLNFILDEIEAHPHACFVFITRGDVNLVLESEFTAKLAADVFHVCEISFMEMAHFVQKNFSMSGAEAEVIALRLRETFQQFDLAAHPSYFAGIPRETLSALLKANRRHELIELAVAGFLSFVVVGDSSDISLSRTTRERFLRLLVFEMQVEKKTFDHAEIVAFTKKFAARYDFEIKPIVFVQGFVDQGILHFDDSDHLRFSLPFIESYLLASELRDRPDQALRHFDLDEQLFDFSTFDIFAEIGASEAIVGRVMTSIDRAINSFTSDQTGPHILLGDRIRPAMMSRPDRLSALQERLRGASEDIQSGKDVKQEKQRLLDMHDRVRESAARRARGATEEEEVNDEEFAMLSKAVQVFVVGAILLGAGAERLGADEKRLLASDLVRLASLILDQWTGAHLQIDFEAVKKDLSTDDAVKSFNQGRDEEHDAEETKKQIYSLVDLMEYVILAHPIRTVISILCEQAGNKVLAYTVEHVVKERLVVGSMEELLLATWLTDLDSDRGRHQLRAALIALPPAPFLRITLCSHYLTRVYWNHWLRQDRLNLLDLAAETLKPLSISFEKSKLKRVIERAANDDADDDDAPGRNEVH